MATQRINELFKSKRRKLNHSNAKEQKEDQEQEGSLYQHAVAKYPGPTEWSVECDKLHKRRLSKPKLSAKEAKRIKDQWYQMYLNACPSNQAWMKYCF